MKKFLIITVSWIVAYVGAFSQVFQVDTLQYRGDINKYINLVIMGDGYLASQQPTFITDANDLSDYLLLEAPFSNYRNYFNVFAIRVVSAESGTRHPNTASDCSAANPLVPISNPNTHLACSFDAFGIHRLVVPQNTSNVVAVLSSNFPNYDQAFVIANTPYYGGSGGTYATATANTSSSDVAVHEIGHSFANLADEYYAGDIYAAEKANMTQQTNPTLVKWKNWMGFNGTGIYQHTGSGNASLWYRPHNNCKMRFLSGDFCSVCGQAIIEKIHSLVNPIVSYSPAGSTINTPNQFIDFKLTELMKPVPNTLNIKWKLDGNDIASDIDSVRIDQGQLALGMHSLVVTVVDTTGLLRVDNHSSVHVSMVNWTINNTGVGVALEASESRIEYAIYPNPFDDKLNWSIQLEKRTKVAVDLVSVDGKIARRVINEPLRAGEHRTTIPVEGLARGTYFVVMRIGDYAHTETVVKR